LSRGHNEEHEALLEKVIVGDLPADAPEVLARTRACADCKIQLAEMLESVAALEREGAWMRRGASPGPVPAESVPSAGEKRALAQLQSLAREQRATALPKARILWLRAALAMAAVALAWIGWAAWSRLGSDPNGTSPPDFALGLAIRDLWPSAEVSEYNRFEWRAELPAGGSYELRIWDPSAPERPLVHEKGLRESRWIPTPAKAAALPAKIEWEVRAIGIDRQDLGAARARASRSAPR